MGTTNQDTEVMQSPLHRTSEEDEEAGSEELYEPDSADQAEEEEAFEDEEEDGEEGRDGFLVESSASSDGGSETADRAAKRPRLDAPNKPTPNQEPLSMIMTLFNKIHKEMESVQQKLVFMRGVYADGVADVPVPTTWTAPTMQASLAVLGKLVNDRTWTAELVRRWANDPHEWTRTKVETYYQQWVETFQTRGPHFTAEMFTDIKPTIKKFRYWRELNEQLPAVETPPVDFGPEPHRRTVYEKVRLGLMAMDEGGAFPWNEDEILRAWKPLWEAYCADRERIRDETRTQLDGFPCHYSWEKSWIALTKVADTTDHLVEFKSRDTHPLCWNRTVMPFFHRVEWRAADEFYMTFDHSRTYFRPTWGGRARELVPEDSPSQDAVADLLRDAWVGYMGFFTAHPELLPHGMRVAVLDGARVGFALPVFTVQAVSTGPVPATQGMDFWARLVNQFVDEITRWPRLDAVERWMNHPMVVAVRAFYRQLSEPPAPLARAGSSSHFQSPIPARIVMPQSRQPTTPPSSTAGAGGGIAKVNIDIAWAIATPAVMGCLLDAIRREVTPAMVVSALNVPVHHLVGHHGVAADTLNEEWGATFHQKIMAGRNSHQVQRTHIDGVYRMFFAFLHHYSRAICLWDLASLEWIQSVQPTPRRLFYATLDTTTTTTGKTLGWSRLAREWDKLCQQNPPMLFWKILMGQLHDAPINNLKL